MNILTVKKYVAGLFLLNAFLVPAFAFGAQCSDTKDNDGDLKCDFEGCTIGATFFPKDPQCSSLTDDNEEAGGAVVTDTGASGTTTDLSFGIENPLESDIDTLPEFINRIVEIFLMIATPIVALMIIYAGFLFVVARGNPEAIEKAKKTLGYTLLGAAILLGAFVISTAIQDTITTISDESTTDTP